MKILNYVSLKLIMIAIACSFAASTPLQARETRLNSVSVRSEDDARLIVARVANFGTWNYLNLFVDGVYVANLGYLRSYETVLTPGRHVLSVTPEVGYCTHTIVNAEPGRTYAFTARWINGYQVRLEGGNGASKQIVAAGMPPAPTSCGRGL
ncbi:MAG: hypothetical protein ACRD6N_19735 [Pyrinomonadaceae bacterium]